MQVYPLLRGHPLPGLVCLGRERFCSVILGSPPVHIQIIWIFGSAQFFSLLFERSHSAFLKRKDVIGDMAKWQKMVCGSSCCQLLHNTFNYMTWFTYLCAEGLTQRFGSSGASPSPFPTTSPNLWNWSLGWEIHQVNGQPQKMAKPTKTTVSPCSADW